MRTPKQANVDAAIAALDSVRRVWLRRPEVAAVDVGFRIKGRELTDEVAIRVHLERKLPKELVPEQELFPTELGGFPVDILEAKYAASPLRASFTGEEEDDGGDDGGGGDGEGGSGLEALTADGEGDPLRRARVQPLVGGISIGNPRVTAGTLGAIVWSLADGAPHILSNWHVLAGSNGGCGGHGASVGQPHYQSLAGIEPHYQALAGAEPHYQGLAGAEPHYQGFAGAEPHYQSASHRQPHYQSALIGEPIYQPGRFDGGTGADIVAHLSDLRLDRHMDAAIARLNGARPYANHLLGHGPVWEIEDKPQLGMRVRKSGRSSGVTVGVIDGVSLSTVISFAHGDQSFDDQLHIVPPGPWGPDGPTAEVSDGGDSGSVWVTEETNRAVGLHFAGEDDPGPANEHALANPMWRVAKALNFSFTPVVQPAPPSAPRPASGPPAAADTSAAATLAQARRVLEVALRALE